MRVVSLRHTVFGALVMLAGGLITPMTHSVASAAIPDPFHFTSAAFTEGSWVSPPLQAGLEAGPVNFGGGVSLNATAVYVSVNVNASDSSGVIAIHPAGSRPPMLWLSSRSDAPAGRMSLAFRSGRSVSRRPRAHGSSSPLSATRAQTRAV